MNFFELAKARLRYALWQSRSFFPQMQSQQDEFGVTGGGFWGVGTDYKTNPIFIHEALLSIYLSIFFNLHFNFKNNESKGNEKNQRILDKQQ